MKVYKVISSVTRNGKKMFVSSNVEPPLELTYEIGKVTTPTVKYSKIFVFIDLDKARHYRDFNICLNLSILECEGPDKVYRTQFMATHYYQVNDFWTRRHLKIRRSFLCSSVPDGTRLADWVKPIQVVH